MEKQLTCVKGSTWHPDDNDVAPHCPPDDGCYVLKMENGRGVWLPYMQAVNTGVVWPFYGYASEIAEGWTLCNGVGELSNGRPVPDMRQRFLMMAQDDEQMATTGGAETSVSSTSGNHSHAIEVKNHTLTIDEMPKHSHRYRNPMAYGLSGHQHSDHSGWDDTSEVGGNKGHKHDATINATGNHSHTSTIIPPFYALAFIIKL